MALVQDRASGFLGVRSLPQLQPTAAATAAYTVWGTSHDDSALANTALQDAPQLHRACVQLRASWGVPATPMARLPLRCPPSAAGTLHVVPPSVDRDVARDLAGSVDPLFVDGIRDCWRQLHW